MYRDLSHVWLSHQMANCLSAEVKLKQLIYLYYYYRHVYNQWQSSVAKCSNVYWCYIIKNSCSYYAGDDGVVRVWELGSGRILRECPPAAPPPVPPPPTGNTSSTSSQQITSLAFSQDGSLLASSSYGNQIRLWNVRTLSSPCHSQVTTSR